MTDSVLPKDLTSIGPASATAAGASPASASQLIEKNYDPTLDRETIRGTIAQALDVGGGDRRGRPGRSHHDLWLLYQGYMHQRHCRTEDHPRSDELVLTPLIGLAGAVTGFHFGEKSAPASRVTESRSA
jgi:hypothetical protein